jgi:hypothetical protein
MPALLGTSLAQLHFDIKSFILIFAASAVLNRTLKLPTARYSARPLLTVWNTTAWHTWVAFRKSEFSPSGFSVNFVMYA